MKRGRDDENRDNEEEYFGECCHERVNGHCSATIIAGVLSSTLSWYCWGLAMSTPGGPFVKALQVCGSDRAFPTRCISPLFFTYKTDLRYTASDAER